jgi:hypothetical protein
MFSYKHNSRSPSPKISDTNPLKLVSMRKMNWALLGLISAIIVASFLVFKDFLLGQKVYLFRDIGSDSINIYFPWLVHLAGYLHESGLPLWTFSQGLGQNMFPFWLSDFFSVFLAFFVNKSLLPFGLVWMEVLKILLCGVMFYFYLRELKLEVFSAGLCAFLYAFCGYIILGGCWTMFSVEALYAATILYGFECWLNRGSWLWYVFGLAFMSMLQPFFLFMYTIFLVLYIPLRYAEVRPGLWKRFPVFLLKTFGFSVLGVALSSWQLLPDVLQYLESPRVGGEAGLAAGLRSTPVFAVADDLLRFSTTFRAFGSDMLGTGSKFTGWSNYLESPLFYCGILCLVIFTQMLPSRQNTRQKLAYGLFTTLWVIPLFLPFFRYGFWAFSGNYFRTFSLFITIIILMYSARSLNHIVTTGRINKVVLGLTAAVLLWLLYFPFDQFRGCVDPFLRNCAAGLVCVYALLLLAIAAKGRLKMIAQTMMALICFAELVCFSYRTVNNRRVVTSQDLVAKAGYNDYTEDAVKFLKGMDNGFYRINKDYSSGLAMHTSINDAKVQGYFGTSSYASFNQINYIRFLGGMNVINERDESETRWAPGTANRMVLFSLVGGKYFLSKRSDIYPANDGFNYIRTVGDVHIYRNRYAMPLGFTYDRVLDERQFIPLAPIQKDLFLLKGCVVDIAGKELASLPRIDLAINLPELTPEQINRDFTVRMQESLTITSFYESAIRGEITVPYPRILFLSIPFDKGWHARINGHETTIHRVNLGFAGILLPAGKNLVELHFTPRLMYVGASMSAVAGVVLILILLTGRRKKKTYAASI